MPQQKHKLVCPEVRNYSAMAVEKKKNAINHGISISLDWYLVMPWCRDVGSDGDDDGAATAAAIAAIASIQSPRFMLDEPNVKREKEDEEKWKCDIKSKTFNWNK